MSAQATRSNMPVVLLKEGTSETKGREAQKNNIGFVVRKLFSCFFKVVLSLLVLEFPIYYPL